MCGHRLRVPGRAVWFQRVRAVVRAGWGPRYRLPVCRRYANSFPNGNNVKRCMPGFGKPLHRKSPEHRNWADRRCFRQSASSGKGYTRDDWSTCRRISRRWCSSLRGTLLRAPRGGRACRRTNTSPRSVRRCRCFCRVCCRPPRSKAGFHPVLPATVSGAVDGLRTRDVHFG